MLMALCGMESRPVAMTLGGSKSSAVAHTNIVPARLVLPIRRHITNSYAVGFKCPLAN